MRWHNLKKIAWDDPDSGCTLAVKMPDVENVPPVTKSHWPVNGEPVMQPMGMCDRITLVFSLDECNKTPNSIYQEGGMVWLNSGV